ncbi:MAG: tonB-system energizer ExbB [Pseudolabrys sp.]|nr:tonB-system energizer ExbB [Pseudolabrys sp.]
MSPYAAVAQTPVAPPADSAAPVAPPPAATAPATPSAEAPATTTPAAESIETPPQPEPAIPPVSETVSPVPDIALNLPRDLSPWGMFMAADIVVKAVMVGLAFASVLSWTVWFGKAIELMVARRRMRRGIAALGEARTWLEAATLQNYPGGAGALIRAADTELRLTADVMSPHPLSPDGVKERIVSRLERTEPAASRAMSRGTGILATIGATAPFVGLFGTVWGIMNSFIGISKAHTTNLAVVAPGIAEALLATAMGLVAAIPAVVMYNFFSRWISGFRAQHADASAEILRIVSRDLDRGAFTQRPADRRGFVAAE